MPVDVHNLRPRSDLVTVVARHERFSGRDHRIKGIALSNLDPTLSLGGDVRAL